MKVNNVLLIEDDMFFATVFRKKLSEMGDFQIHLFPSVERALGNLKEIAPEIIFLDHHLGGIDGVDALPLIKELVPKAEVVIVSSERNPEVLDQAIETGATKFFSKNSLLMNNTKEFISELEKKTSSFTGFWNSFISSYSNIPRSI